MDDYKIIVEQEHQTVVGHYDVVTSHGERPHVSRFSRQKVCGLKNIP